MNVRVAAGWTAVLPAFAVFGVFVATASAAPRRVAIVNATANQGDGDAAARVVRAALDKEKALAPLPSGDLARALEGLLSAGTPEQKQLAEATATLSAAQEDYASFAYDASLEKLGAAELILLGLEPSPVIHKLLADINFRKGLIWMSKPDRAQALERFRLARRLDPDRGELDKAKYDDEIRKAFAESGSERANSATLVASTRYDRAVIYVDGSAIGAKKISLPPGDHYVIATFPDHQPRGQRIGLSPGETQQVTLVLAPRTADERARSLRRDLLQENGAANRYLVAGQTAASLAGVDAVIVLRGDGHDGVAGAIYDGRDDKLGAWTPFDAASADKLLEPLRPVIIPPFDGNPEIPVTPKPWYEKTWGQGLLFSGATLTVLGIVSLALSGNNGPDTVMGGPCGFKLCP